MTGENSWIQCKLISDYKYTRQVETNYSNSVLW
jgi:hypothetical protein